LGSFDFVLLVAVAALIWATVYLLRHGRKGRDQLLRRD